MNILMLKVQVIWFGAGDLQCNVLDRFSQPCGFKIFRFGLHHLIADDFINGFLKAGKSIVFTHRGFSEIV